MIRPLSFRSGPRFEPRRLTPRDRRFIESPNHTTPPKQFKRQIGAPAFSLPRWPPAQSGIDVPNVGGHFEYPIGQSCRKPYGCNDIEG